MIPPDVFVLRWAAIKTDVALPLVMVQMECDVLYTTGGTQTASGLDRGRALAQMDAELIAILSPPSTPKLNYVVTPAAQMNTPVFWSAAEFMPTETLRDRLLRTAKVIVFTYQEPGEQ